MKKYKVILPTGVTEEQVAAWKEKHGQDKIHLAELYNGEDKDPFLLIVKTPNRVSHHQFEKWAESNPLKAKEILVKDCLLTSIEEVMADDTLFLSAFGAVSQLLPRGAAAIKNL